MSVPEPYYSDELVTLHLGDCREVTDWLAANVLVTDPPYGRNWRQGDRGKKFGWRDDSHPGIAGDEDTSLRDCALAAWGDRHAIVFGDFMLASPDGTKQVLAFQKPSNAGTKGTFAGFRRDIEAVYLVGPWPGGHNGRSSVLATNARTQCSQAGVPAKYGHPHAKPVDVMEDLIRACPPGVIADPFAGSGSTLVAARNLGRRAIGVELEEKYAERAARRLSQGAFDFGEAS